MRLKVQFCIRRPRCSKTVLKSLSLVKNHLTRLFFFQIFLGFLFRSGGLYESIPSPRDYYNFIVIKEM